MAYDRKHFAAAARLWAEALASRPEAWRRPPGRAPLQRRLRRGPGRPGQGQGDPPPDDAAKARLRQQALDWLKAELATWTKLLESGPPQARQAIVQTLDHWKQDADLAGIREAEALAKLPAEEQKAWRTLWSDVESLLKRTAIPVGCAK